MRPATQYMRMRQQFAKDTRRCQTAIPTGISNRQAVAAALNKAIMRRESQAQVVCVDKQRLQVLMGQRFKGYVTSSGLSGLYWQYDDAGSWATANFRNHGFTVTSANAKRDQCLHRLARLSKPFSGISRSATMTHRYNNKD